MQPEAIIPQLDPIPLPGPIWLLKLLLLLTFFLHLIAMNLLVGRAIQAFFARWGARGAPGEKNRQKLIADILQEQPTLIAATVTLGVAPLLFIQVLKGHLVYTAGIALGWFWWLVLPVLILAYYIYYGLKFRRESSSLPSPWWLGLGAVSLLWISFILSNNFNLAAQPDRFTSMLTGSPTRSHLNLGDPTTFPRWLHIVLGAVAVSGVWTMWKGRTVRETDRDQGDYLLQWGYKYFAYPTMVNILVGFIFMMTLPRPIMLRLMGQGLGETILWLVGLGTALWAISLFKRATTSPQSAALPWGTFMLLVALVSMVLLRDLVRSAYQSPYFTLAQLRVESAWGPLILFLITFTLGLIVFYWLIKTYYQPRPSSGER